MSRFTDQQKARIRDLIADGVIERDTVRKIKNADPRRLIEYEIGDIHSDDFLPQFKTKHWGNEANFSARLDLEGGEIIEHNGKLGYKKGPLVARFYELNDTDDEDGAFEFDILLLSKPSRNWLRWTLRHKELDFYYQPEITDEEAENDRKDGDTRPV